jgi:hypothetical protein
MGIAFKGIREDALDEMRYGNAEERELALRIDAANAREESEDFAGSAQSGISVYQMCINNVARTIRRQPEEKQFDAFTCSEVLAIAFCKSKEEVCGDTMRAKV